MKILAIETDVDSATNELMKPFLNDEAKEVWKFYKAGIIREIYFTADHRAILILECKDESEATALLEILPLVKRKLIRFQIIPLTAYDGFERLFSEKD